MHQCKINKSFRNLNLTNTGIHKPNQDIYANSTYWQGGHTIHFCTKLKRSGISWFIESRSLPFYLSICKDQNHFFQTIDLTNLGKKKKGAIQMEKRASHKQY